MLVIFTDLDGTLLDRETYSWREASRALGEAERCGVPVIFTTSKTCAETEYWRTRAGNRHPFTYENGGAIGGAQGILRRGRPYGELVAALESASRSTGVPVRGFRDMTAAEIALRCGMCRETAELAKRREFDEPFEILEPLGASRLLRAIEAAGYRWTRGGRFHHIHGDHDKAAAVRLLAGVYAQLAGTLTTIGLGDAMNDAAFLNAVDVPIVVRSKDSDRLRQAVPRASVTRLVGPAGWNQAVLDLLGRLWAGKHRTTHRRFVHAAHLRLISG